MSTSEQPHPVDPPDRFEYRMERTYEVGVTPEQAWDAIATAEGISAWMVPTRLDPRVGGEVSFDHGGFTSTGAVTAYEPTRRFAYEEPWPVAAGEPIPAGMLPWFESIGADLDQVQEDLASVSPVANEFLVEAASGGSCVIRVVSSSYGTGADWEHEFFAEMIVGWSELLDRLVPHLTERASR